MDSINETELTKVDDYDHEIIVAEMLDVIYNKIPEDEHETLLKMEYPTHISPIANKVQDLIRTYDFNTTPEMLDFAYNTGFLDDHLKDIFKFLVSENRYLNKRRKNFKAGIPVEDPDTKERIVIIYCYN